MCFMFQILKSKCVLVTFLTPIEVTRHFHFIENSFTWDVSQSSEVSIPKLDFFSLQLARSKVTSSNPMSLEKCLKGLVPVAKTLNVLQVLQGLPRKTGCKHGPGKTARRLGHGLDTSCGLVGPSLTQEHSLRITFCVA